MKTKFPYLFIALVLLAGVNWAAAQGTAFTYQGRLQTNDSPASGTYNLAFTLFTNITGGAVIAGPVTNNGVIVSNGLFTVLIDFDPAVFTGATNWLQIGVETNGANTFTTLTPRQQLTPAPYAIDAESAGNLSGTLPATQLTGIVPTNVLPGFQGSFDTVGGGQGNIATTLNATVAGGANNTASAQNATVAGGDNNMAGGDGAAIGGGSANAASGAGDFIGGGGYDGTNTSGNNIQANAATIGGGLANNISIGGPYDFIGGGQFNTNAAFNSTIGGGAYNYIQPSAYQDTIGGGANNTIQINATDSTIGGGTVNSIQTNSYQSTIAGGNLNMILANAHQSAIGGGNQNVIQANAVNSTIGGGNQNNASGQYATVPGGNKNVAGGNYSFAAGDEAQATNSGAFVWADAEGTPFVSTTTNQFNVRANGGVQFVTGGAGMTVDGLEIQSNSVQAIGDLNLQAGKNMNLTASNNFNALVKANFTMSVGNDVNVTATAEMNLTGDTSMQLNAGTSMQVKAQDAMLVQSAATIQVIAESSLTLSGSQLLLTGGNVGIGTNNPTQPLMMGSGAYCSAAGVWQSVSDRKVKEDFTSIKPAEVLAKVAALPITQWKYKVERNGIKHLGPVAQDFYSSFGLGDDDKAIGAVDEGGVALAAIQGLNQKLNEKDAEIEGLKEKADKVDSLEKQLNELKQMVQSLAAKK